MTDKKKKEHENQKEAIQETKKTEKHDKREKQDKHSKALEEKNEEIKKLEEKLLRLTAEFENYKKRARTELENMGKYGTEELMLPLLMVVDNFERAVVQKPDETKIEAFYEGVNLIYKQLMEILEAQGLEKIKAQGEKFDPSYHQGVMNDVVEDEKLIDTVTEEFQTGYLLNKKVIRPTMVKIGIKG